MHNISIITTQFHPNQSQNAKTKTKFTAFIHVCSYKHIHTDAKSYRSKTLQEFSQTVSEQSSKALKCSTSNADIQLNRPEMFPQVTRTVLTSPEQGLLYLRPGYNLTQHFALFVSVLTVHY